MSETSKEITKLLANFDVPFTASKAEGTDEVSDWKLTWPSALPNHGDYEIRIRLHEKWVFILHTEDIPDRLKESTQFYIRLLKLNGRGGEQKIALTSKEKIVVWATVPDVMMSPPFFNQIIAAVAKTSEDVIKLIDEKSTSLYS